LVYDLARFETFPPNVGLVQLVVRATTEEPPPATPWQVGRREDQMSLEPPRGNRDQRPVQLHLPGNLRRRPGPRGPSGERRIERSPPDLVFRVVPLNKLLAFLFPVFRRDGDG
jgi:hypothetical protein